VQHFAYDAESRLIEVRSDNGSVVKMAYDPLGRRIAKAEHDNNGYPLGETRFIWDGMRLLQESRYNLTSLYLYTDNTYEPLARIDGYGAHQKVRYYHNDLNGLPEQLTEADGHTVWQATYRVWGNTLEEVREPYYIEEQNLRFQGQYLDRETGLHFNTFRFYDPDVGRFTTPDPIGLEGGLNIYQYAQNPISWIDPWGLAPELYYLIATIDGHYDEMAWGHKKPVSQVFLKKGDIWKMGETINPSRRYTAKWLRSKKLAYKRIMAAPTKGNMQAWEKLKIGKYFRRRGKLPPGNKCRH
jgi:RHS repeat-associated protein